MLRIRRCWELAGLVIVFAGCTLATDVDRNKIPAGDASVDTGVAGSGGTASESDAGPEKGGGGGGGTEGGGIGGETGEAGSSAEAGTGGGEGGSGGAGS